MVYKNSRQKKAAKSIEIPRGKLVGEFGPGSMYVDTSGISYLISAVDKWYSTTGELNINKLEISNQRLEQFLGVETFREVPKFMIDVESNINTNMKVPIQRFPLVHYCITCGTLSESFSPNSNEKKKYCKYCEADKEFVQFPIVVVCEKGHIMDFPYFKYTHSLKEHKKGFGNRIYLDRSNATSILNWTIKCECGAEHSLSGVTGQSNTTGDGKTPYQREMNGNANCWGHRPWVGKGVEDGLCNHQPVAILKNSLATYRSETIPALAISSTSQTEYYDYKNILLEEYKKLSGEHQDDKLIVDEAFSMGGKSIISKVHHIRRLEEIVVQTGFHRLAQSDIEDSIIKANNSENGSMLFTDNLAKPSWYPAKLLYGEGIFIEFSQDVLENWTNNLSVKARFEKLSSRTKDFYLSAQFDSPIKVLLHTISHGLAEELSKDSGYQLASIKEKLFGDDGKYGILLYVTDADKDGTYGGVVRLAEEELFKPLFHRTIQNLEWCSSDPVCMELGDGIGQGLQKSNGAACHNCSFIPDTSCSYRNCFLDRAYVAISNSDCSIANDFEWFSEANDIKVIDAGKTNKKTWQELGTFESDEDIKKLCIPTSIGGQVLIEETEYDMKYLWKDDNRIALYSDQASDIDTTKYPKWKILKVEE